MKLFQVLIALFILTLSASVYAMGVYLQPVSFGMQRQSVNIKLNSVHPVIAAQKKSSTAEKIRLLVDQQRFSRLLASSS